MIILETYATPLSLINDMAVTNDGQLMLQVSPSKIVLAILDPTIMVQSTREITFAGPQLLQILKDQFGVNTLLDLIRNAQKVKASTEIKVASSATRLLGLSQLNLGSATRIPQLPRRWSVVDVAVALCSGQLTDASMVANANATTTELSIHRNGNIFNLLVHMHKIRAHVSVIAENTQKRTQRLECNLGQYDHCYLSFDLNGGFGKTSQDAAGAVASIITQATLKYPVDADLVALSTKVSKLLQLYLGGV